MGLGQGLQAQPLEMLQRACYPSLSARPFATVREK